MTAAFDQSFEHDLHHSDAGRQILEAFDFQDEIYRSDQSVLYKVSHIETQEVFVLKGIRKNSSYTFSVETIQKIKSPLINKIVDFYESDYYLYLIEDYVEGMNLEQYIAKTGVLAEQEAKVIILEVAQALGHLHGYGKAKYVFRDLKPSNIMIKPRGEIVLIDVITIREIKEKKTQDTFVIGTKGYTAPEAYGFMQTSEQSDIFSLGATLFFLLTGVQPANIQSFKMQLEDYKHIPGYLKAIIEKSTAFNPQDRFENVQQFVQALQDEKLEVGPSPRKKQGPYMAPALGLGALLVLVIILVALRGMSLSVLGHEAGADQLLTDLEVGAEGQTSISESTIQGTAQSTTLAANGPYKIDQVMSRDQFRVSNLDLIEEGIHFVLYDNDVIKITFDRSLLPEGARDFTYISVGTSSVPLTMKQWSESTFDDLVNGDGFEAFVDKGFYSRLDDRNCVNIILYNIYKEPVAYYATADVRQGLAIEHFEEPVEVLQRVGVHEFEKDVYFDYKEEGATFFADNKTLPKFTKVSIWSKPESFTNEDLTYIQNEIRAGRGIKTYQNVGVPTGYGDASAFLEVNWLVYLVDENNKIVKEYRRDKE